MPCRSHAIDTRPPSSVVDQAVEGVATGEACGESANQAEADQEGVVLRDAPEGFDEDDARAAPYMRSLDPLLCSAYHAALEAAASCGARSL